MKTLREIEEVDIESEADEQGSGFKVNDILFILFKHKWKILVSTCIGLMAAVGAYYQWPRVYVSEAKLLVRYVVDRTPLDPDGGSGSRREDSVINAELEILTSRDLATQVVEGLGVKRLLPEANGDVTPIEVAGLVTEGLAVSGGRGSNVISVSYRNADPSLAPIVLTGLVEKYFKKHLELHRPTGGFEFVEQQSLASKNRLDAIEDELKQKKAEARITSLPETFAILNGEAASCQNEINSAEAELASQRAVLSLIAGARDASEANPAKTQGGDSETSQPQSGDVLRYQSLVKNLAQLRDLEMGLRVKFTGENRMLKLNQAQIQELENERRALEKKIPNISVQSKTTDFATERSLLAGVEARRDAWRARLQGVENRIAELSALAPKITELELRKQIEEGNHKTAIAALEKARTDDWLDPSKMPNISIVQNPSPPRLDLGKASKVIIGLAFGGLAFGVGIALLIELVLDRRIKRPIELESILGIPLMLSVPTIATAGRLRLSKRGRRASPWAGDGDGDFPGGLAPWAVGHFIRRYAESIRDRLIMYFQINGLGHKPKLVAVTGVMGGAGTSTIAGGLAAALSETGDGKVLLVDMNPDNAGAHPFFMGKPTSSIADALQGSENAVAAGDNLYLATTGPLGESGKHLLPKRFYEMVPNFKASDYDYIIFDMPPLNQSSATLAVAGVMDKVLLVVEAEKGGRDVMKRACMELTAARAKVSGIFNMARSYGPKWLHDDEVGSLALPWAPTEKVAVAGPPRKSKVAFRLFLFLGFLVAAMVISFFVLQERFPNIRDKVQRGVHSLKGMMGFPGKKGAPSGDFGNPR